MISGKQAASVVIICFGELEHAWITHYHPAACPMLTVLCRSIAVLRAVTIKTGSSGGAKPAELFAVLLLALQRFSACRPEPVSNLGWIPGQEHKEDSGLD